MKESRSKYLLKNTLIFTLGNIGSKVIIFLLIPLYTNALSTSEYGTVDLISTIGMVAGPILTLNISEAVMRFGLDKNTDRNKNTQVGFVVLVSGTLIGLFLTIILGNISVMKDYAIYIFLYAISLASSQVFLCDLRGKEMLLKYSIGNILQALSIAVLNIVFLKVLTFGIKGYLFAYIISYFISALYAIVAGKGYHSFGFHNIDFVKMRSMIKYSIVLIPNTFMWWIMNSSDRLMVIAMISAEANGIYAVSYKLPTLVSVLSTIFNQAWSYSAIREEGTDDECEYNNKVFKQLTTTSFFVGLCILAVAKPFLRIYVNDKFYEAWKYIPFLMVGCVFLTLATFISTSYTVHKDSFGFLISGTVGAVINIGLNYLLIPYIGVSGAALATCVSYIAVFIFRLIHTRKYIIIHINYFNFYLGIVLLMFSAISMYADEIVFSVLRLLIVIVYVIMNKSMIMMPLNTIKQKIIKNNNKNL